MVRFAGTLTLIFSSFLLLHAYCLQPNQPDNLVVKWISSSTNDLPFPDSSSEVEIFPSNYLTESAAIPKIRLPSQSEPTAVTVFSDNQLQPNPPENQVVEWNPSGLATLPEKPKEDAVPSVIVAESEPTDAVELPGSEAIRSSNEYGFHFHFHFPFGFHFHSHCHHQEKPNEEKHKKQGFHFDFRFPFAFHFHSHSHHHEKKEREREKQFEPRIAGEEIPSTNGGDMIKARTAGFLDGKRVHHYKLIGDAEGIMKMEGGKKKPYKKGCKKEKEDDEGTMRFEEGKKKPHKKEWKKEKEDDDWIMKPEEGKMKHHKKEWKTEKEEGEGKMRVEEENKMKGHKKKWKKEKEDYEGKLRVEEETKMKGHKKEWKKKKEDAGLVKSFQKFFKHFRKFNKQSS